MVIIAILIVVGIGAVILAGVWSNRIAAEFAVREEIALGIISEKDALISLETDRANSLEEKVDSLEAVIGGLAATSILLRAAAREALKSATGTDIIPDYNETDSTLITLLLDTFSERTGDPGDGSD